MGRRLSTAALCFIASSSSALSAQSLADRIDGLLRNSNLSGSVIVTQGGATVLSAGYGMANRELGVPNTPSSKHRIGSITKQFTAMAVLILQDQGKLHVEDRVGEHLKSVPESWQQLTLHQLLTHTSGIMHSWALPGFAEIAMVPITLDETLELFFDEPLQFTPGEGFQYSGLGYFLLAKIIEEVSGQEYDAFLKAEILGPLGMEDTGPDRPEILLENRAAGYVLDDSGSVRNAPGIYVPILTGGGHLYSTVEDMSRWDRALARHALLSSESYSAMYRAERQGYAYGWTVGEFEGRRAISHSGGMPGFNAHILRLPDEDVCVIVLTNLTPGQARPVAQSVATLVLDEAGQHGDSF